MLTNHAPWRSVSGAGYVVFEQEVVESGAIRLYEVDLRRPGSSALWK